MKSHKDTFFLLLIIYCWILPSIVRSESSFSESYIKTLSGSGKLTIEDDLDHVSTNKTETVLIKESDKLSINGFNTDCGRIYVDSSLTNVGNGTSWDSAYNSLSLALMMANEGCPETIWIAKGTYYPDMIPDGCDSCTSPRDVTFLLKNGVKIYGGFAGHESVLSARVAGNTTILSGDIGVKGDSTDNAFHVVVSINDDNTTLIDGITIAHGNAYYEGTTQIGKYEEYDGNYFYRNTGGGLYILNSELKVTNVKFENNSAYFGGAVGIDFGSVIPQSVTSTIKNKEQLSPLNIRAENRKSKNVKEKSAIIKNEKYLKTGIVSTGVEIINSSFVNNSANYGGGIEIEYGENILIKNNSFLNNKSLYEGGGIYDEFSSGSVVENCVFNNNTVTEGGYGGAVSIDEVEMASILKCRFYNNKVQNDGYGGGLSDYFGNKTKIDSCTFDSNIGEDGGFGGGLYIGRTTDAYVLKSRFINNSVTNEGYGGAFYEDDALSTVVDSCVFEENTALNNGEGGAMYIDSDSTSILNSFFRANQAFNGAAVFSYEKGLKVSKSIFKDNIASNEGGAINAYYEAKIEASEFIGNEAYYGGAIYTFDDALVINSLIAHNKAEVGGGIYSDSRYNVDIINCTIANNMSMDDGGGGIYNDGSSMNISNSILWNNGGSSTDTIENQLYIDGVTMLSNSISQGGLEPDNDGGNNFFVDPGFNNPSKNGDYRLNCTSAAINKGNNTLNTLISDLDGKMRRIGDNIDIGAYENSGGYLNPINGILGSTLVCPGDKALVYEINAQACATGYAWSNIGDETLTNNITATSITLDSIVSPYGDSINLEVNVFNGIDNVQENVKIYIASQQLCTVLRCGQFPNLIIDSEYLNAEFTPVVLNEIKAVNSIKSNAIVPQNGRFIFKAGQFIELEKSFTVQLGAEFTAQIEECPHLIED